MLLLVLIYIMYIYIYIVALKRHSLGEGLGRWSVVLCWYIVIWYDWFFGWCFFYFTPRFTGWAFVLRCMCRCSIYIDNCYNILKYFYTNIWPTPPHAWYMFACSTHNQSHPPNHAHFLMYLKSTHSNDIRTRIRIPMHIYSPSLPFSPLFLFSHN